MSGDRMWCDVMWCEESVFTYDGAVDLGVDGAQPLQLHHGLGLFPLLTAALQAPVEELHHLSHEQLHQLTDHLYLWHTGGRRDGQTERQTTDRQTDRATCGRTDTETDTLVPVCGTRPDLYQSCGWRSAGCSSHRHRLVLRGCQSWSCWAAEPGRGSAAEDRRTGETEKKNWKPDVHHDVTYYQGTKRFFL